MWPDLVDKTFASYPINRPDVISELFVFKAEPEDRYSTNGTASGKNLYNVVEEKLVHVVHGDKVTASLEDGEFVWSHGYRSRLHEEDDCDP